MKLKEIFFHNCICFDDCIEVKLVSIECTVQYKKKEEEEEEKLVELKSERGKKSKEGPFVKIINEETHV
jgi:hypothetical protein